MKRAVFVFFVLFSQNALGAEPHVEKALALMQEFRSRTTTEDHCIRTTRNPAAYRIGDFRSSIENYGVAGQSRGTLGSGSLNHSSALPVVAKVPTGTKMLSLQTMNLSPSQIDEIEKAGFLPLGESSWMQYGNWQTIEAVMVAAANVAQRFPETKRRPLLVGDLSQKNGGNTGHNSHANGLDADLVYYDLGQPHTYQDTHGKDEDVLGNKKFISTRNSYGGGVHPNFDFERNWALLEEFAKVNLASQKSNGKKIVKAAFIHSTIANGLKEYGRKNNKDTVNDEVYREALRIIYPYSGHTVHMHVRFEQP